MRIRSFWLFVALLSFSLHATEQQAIDSIKKASPASQVVDLSLHEGLGMYYFQTDNGVSGYISQDGRYIMNSELLLVEPDGGLVNETKTQAIRSLLRMSENNFIVYESDLAKSPKLGEVVIFTDITCGYCQLLHNRINELVSAGVEVKYIAYPREGLNGSVQKAMNLVWCAKDRKHAFNYAMKMKGNMLDYGGEFDQACSREMVSAGYLSGSSVGIRGTPAIVFEDGTLKSGYMMAEDLVEAVKRHTPKLK